MAITRSIELPISHPKVNEQAMLIDIMAMMTAVRPQRSDRVPAIAVEKTP